MPADSSLARLVEWLRLEDGEVWGGMLAGLVATLVFWVVARLIRWKRNRDDFGSLAGDYDVTEKWGEAEAVVATVTIEAKGPILSYRWVDSSNGTVANGQIVMNEQSRVTGAGSYDHQMQTLGWGWVQLQVASSGRDRLLVDGVFTDPVRLKQVARGWVWTRRPTA